MRWFLLALCSACCASLWAGTQPAASDQAFAAALQALDGCAARLDPEADVGYERIAARCPQLPERLTAAGVDPWLPRSWRDSRNDLSAGGLQELRSALERERALSSVSRTPSPQRLKAMLLEMGSSAQERGSLWRRFANWLHTIVSLRGRPQDPGLLERIVARIGLPETLIQITTYLALGITIALALFVLVQELRAAGVLRRPNRRRREEMPAIPRESGELEWQDIERAQPSERPRLILTLILERLTRVQALPPARSLTTRELTRAVRLEAAEDAHRVAQLAAIAERVRYAPVPASAAEVGQALELGRTLLQVLGADGSLPHPR